MATAYEILVRAKELIEKIGWTTGGFGRRKRNPHRTISPHGLQLAIDENDCGGLCVGGAIILARLQLGPEPGVDESRGMIRGLNPASAWTVLNNVIGSSSGVTYWNDNMMQTRQNVLDTLDKAIAAAKEMT